MTAKPRKSILVVDDESSVRESLRLILKSQYEVFTAADGQEALECIQKEKIDLVTLDLKMPGLSGIDVLREIKKIRDDLEVIIITAYGTPTNASESIYFGAGDFILKPFDVFDVTVKVKKSLARQDKNVEIKKVIGQIHELLPPGEKKKEEKLLVLSQNLCSMLEGGEYSYPAGIEDVMNFQFPKAGPQQARRNRPASPKVERVKSSD